MTPSTRKKTRTPDPHAEGIRLLLAVLAAHGLLRKPAAEFLRDKDGRPYIRDAGFDFNLSHSGRFLLCAVSDRRVGADVQVHGPVRESVLRRCYGEEERTAFAASADPVRTFYDIWTQKEAYAKYDGAGLRLLLSPVDAEKRAAAAGLHLLHIPMGDGVSAAVCTSYTTPDVTEDY